MRDFVIFLTISMLLLLAGAGLLAGIHDNYLHKTTATTNAAEATLTLKAKLETLTETASKVTHISPFSTISNFGLSTFKIHVREDYISTTSAILTSTVTINCDNKWCQDGTSLCAYWAGITGWDPAEGPIPGETVASIGKCTAVPTQAENQKRSTVNHMLITPAPFSSSVDCKYKYCDSSTQYCMYWAGVTGWDPSLGPIPGMTRTSLGACQAPPTAITNTITLPTTLVTKKCTRSN
ncbi:hypothetical protein CORC01_09203 [Colletotrichum orchidophilum]|uniref:Uncharacterized protein n=1 Tax=Colletotrichum orchidophilum TaxID=1209926 RepID=A0A1G4B229_9PEZI|nr:uncharacterized protein CORC01_09203 [Colletotrichum orchidophilum]OHE95470.1 hypothetical protein CORC01_09203 [Colletotrichum orchidophilum]